MIYGNKFSGKNKEPLTREEQLKKNFYDIHYRLCVEYNEYNNNARAALNYKDKSNARYYYEKALSVAEKMMSNYDEYIDRGMKPNSAENQISIKIRVTKRDIEKCNE